MAQAALNMTAANTRYPVVIAGLGLTGLSCARYLASRGETFAVTDTRTDPPMAAALRQELPDVPLILGGFDPGLLLDARRIIISPGVAPDEPAIQAAREAGVEVIGDVELFCQMERRPIIAITGTNGKSTVTSLVGEMLKRAGRKAGIAGNIGLPVLDLVADPDLEIFVLELSSFQLETIESLDASAAVVLNITQDHLDRYRSIKEYVAAKQRIYNGTGVMVINLDDALTSEMRLPGRSVIGFGLNEPEGEDLGLRNGWLARGDRPLMPVSDLRLCGRHNAVNCLAALALGYAAGIPEAAMLDTLRNYAGLPHRCQRVAEINGVVWYDDSKGTNPGASCSAIIGLGGDRNVILIAGGIGKGADFSVLRPAISGRLKSAILIGRDAGLIEEAIGGVVETSFAADMEDAVRLATAQARAGDVVLLSPACASFDMFRDYRHRGEVFIDAVRRLQETESC
ncbi:MAG TPA: UDP-N-acetylmuramoyl-L-alanine--D-glutamate ligase [Gammaproteobacteria bacterium]|nr:UDP-N-acetylmuramoyl-L-alanine--D-glutamate ligase [Gammaproteobacteria bacterium]